MFFWPVTTSTVKQFHSNVPHFTLLCHRPSLVRGLVVTQFVAININISRGFKHLKNGTGGPLSTRNRGQPYWVYFLIYSLYHIFPIIKRCRTVCIYLYIYMQQYIARLPYTHIYIQNSRLLYIIYHLVLSRSYFHFLPMKSQRLFSVVEPRPRCGREFGTRSLPIHVPQ